MADVEAPPDTFVAAALPTPLLHASTASTQPCWPPRGHHPAHGHNQQPSKGELPPYRNVGHFPQASAGWCRVLDTGDSVKLSNDSWSGDGSEWVDESDEEEESDTESYESYSTSSEEFRRTQ